jgi:four helix bundle protein
MRTTTTASGLRFMRLDVYRVAREVVTRVAGLRLADVELRSQVTRASKSMLLNLAEGVPSRSAAVRRRYFEAAKGSAYEVAAAVDIAGALGMVEGEEVAAILDLCHPVSAMLSRMR